MRTTTKISINNMPKAFKAVLMPLGLINIFFIVYKINNDFYFLCPMGEYIWHNGFPNKDMLSMHGDMNIIIQQWIADIIFYRIYSLFAKIGIYILVSVCYVVLFCLIFRLCLTASDNFISSLLCSVVSTMPIAVLFITSRPQIFTFIIVALEVNILETFIKTKKVPWLFILPLLSLLQINIHSSMWIMLFVFMLPYIAGTLPIKIKKLPNLNPDSDKKSFLWLVLSALLSAVTGVINPYGLKAVTYIFTSFGYGDISDSINEMRPLSFGSLSNNLVIIVVAISVLIIFIKGGIKNLRLDLLYLGTLFMSLITYKSTAYFLIVAPCALSYCLRDFDITLNVKNNTKNSSKKTRRLLATLLCVAVVLLGGSVYYSQTNSESQVADNKNTISAFNYNAIDDMLDIIEKSEKDVILFSGFNSGAYIEYKGYHPYIDGRAELFMKVNNGSFDYLGEYRRLQSSKLNYRDFVDKYNFNFLIVTNHESYLYTCLENDSDFEKLYENKTNDTSKIALFMRKDKVL